MTDRYICDARILERKFRELLKMFCADVAALTTGKLAVVYRKTSQRIYELLRSRVVGMENEFARRKNHVNGIASFWGYTKFRFLKLRGVRPEFFLLHLKKSEWRWNRVINLNLARVLWHSFFLV